MRRIRYLGDHFFAGLLVLIPISVVGWMILSIFNLLWKVHFFLPTQWQPETFFGQGSISFVLNALITVGLSFLMGVGVSVLGWTSKQYLGEKTLQLINNLIQRIPVIRSVYTALDQLLRTFTASGGQQFNRVVYLEYPRKGVWTLAFVTGPAQMHGVNQSYLNLYVPTTPNPTSGFHLIVPEEEIRDAHLSVEEAFKTILSLGIAQSQEVGSLKKNSHTGS